MRPTCLGAEVLLICFIQLLSYIFCNYSFVCFLLQLPVDLYHYCWGIFIVLKGHGDQFQWEPQCESINTTEEKCHRAGKKPFHCIHREVYLQIFPCISSCHPQSTRTQWCQLYLIDWVKRTQISQNNGHKNLYMTSLVREQKLAFSIPTLQSAATCLNVSFLPKLSPIKLAGCSKVSNDSLDNCSNCCSMNEA